MEAEERKKTKIFENLNSHKAFKSSYEHMILNNNTSAFDSVALVKRMKTRSLSTNTFHKADELKSHTEESKT